VDDNLAILRTLKTGLSGRGAARASSREASNTRIAAVNSLMRIFAVKNIRGYPAQ